MPLRNALGLNWLLVSLMATTVGCNQLNTKFTEASSSGGTSDTDSQAVVATDSLACLATTADYELETDVLSFQMNSGTSGSVGFSLSGILKVIGLGATYSTGTLEMGTHLFEPLKQTAALADAQGTSTLKSMNLDASVSVWLAALDFSHYQATSIATLSNGALQNAMANIVTQLRGTGGVEQPWSTVASRLIDADDFLVPVGSNAGLQVGDQFGIYNVSYEWANAPCASALLMARRLSSTPIAIATVQQIDTASAYLIVTKRNTADVIQKYAALEVSKLVNSAAGKARTASSLARSLHVGGITQSQSLSFATATGTQVVDLTPFVGEQLSTVVRSTAYGGFYLR